MTIQDDLWVITCYFNPARFHRRLANYRIFRQRLNAPLVTVELSFGDGFDLRTGDADELVQIRGDAVMWQKERLLNVALSRLPPSCTKVAWLDCDVVFERPDWAQCTREALDTFPVVAPFLDVFEIAEHASAEQIDPEHSYRRGRTVIYAYAHEGARPELFDGSLREKGYTSGLGWSANREVLEGLGLYDACVMGGGDRAYLCAALGMYDRATRFHKMSPAWCKHYLSWAKRYYRRVRGQVGFVDGAAFHLWHGDLKHRKHVQRTFEFERFGFDPARDIAIDDRGSWRWNSEKPDMHAYVRKYFASRNEDG